MENTFSKKSYEAHKKHYNDKVHCITERFDKNSIDYWRHERMLELANPLITENEKWLTVGDGIGTDANWLTSKNLDVLASDISGTLLEIAKQKNLISDFSVENAENLSFKSNLFDYSICKEAYHHFPKPYLALYEMLRVSKKGIILIEPIDIGIHMPSIILLKNMLDKFNVNYIDKIWRNRYSFEAVGNYVYKVSEREIEKVAMGINLPYIAFKGLNDYYNPLVTKKPKSNEKIFKKVKNRLLIRNILSYFGFTPYQILSCIIFKEIPSAETITKLNKSNYKLIKLPKNPYI